MGLAHLIAHVAIAASPQSREGSLECEGPCKVLVLKEDLLQEGGCSCFIPITKTGRLIEQTGNLANWKDFNWTGIYTPSAYLRREAMECAQRGVECDARYKGVRANRADEEPSPESFNTVVDYLVSRKCEAAARTCVRVKRDGLCCAESFYEECLAICNHKGYTGMDDLDHWVRGVSDHAGWKMRIMPEWESGDTCSTEIEAEMQPYEQDANGDATRFMKKYKQMLEGHGGTTGLDIRPPHNAKMRRLHKEMRARAGSSEAHGSENLMNLLQTSRLFDEEDEDYDDVDEDGQPKYIRAMMDALGALQRVQRANGMGDDDEIDNLLAEMHDKYEREMRAELEERGLY
jgi:hypothetical protein